MTAAAILGFGAPMDPRLAGSIATLARRAADLERQIGAGLGHPLQLGPPSGLSTRRLASRARAGLRPRPAITPRSPSTQVAWVADRAPGPACVRGCSVVQLAVQGGNEPLSWTTQPPRAIWCSDGVQGQAPPRRGCPCGCGSSILAHVAVKPLTLKAAGWKQRVYGGEPELLAWGRPLEPRVGGADIGLWLFRFWRVPFGPGGIAGGLSGAGKGLPFPGPMGDSGGAAV